MHSFIGSKQEIFTNQRKILSIVSKPLTAYYCFLNATKALLEIKNVGYDLSHGAMGKRINDHIGIQNELVKFQPAGILAVLGKYLGKHVTAGGEEFTLKNIFYNLPFIYRTFTITYSNMAKLFIPVLEPRFVYNNKEDKGWLELKLEPEHSTIRNLGDWLVIA